MMKYLRGHKKLLVVLIVLLAVISSVFLIFNQKKHYYNALDIQRYIAENGRPFVVAGDIRLVDVSEPSDLLTSRAVYFKDSEVVVGLHDLDSILAYPILVWPDNAKVKLALTSCVEEGYRNYYLGWYADITYFVWDPDKKLYRKEKVKVTRVGVDR